MISDLPKVIDLFRSMAGERSQIHLKIEGLASKNIPALLNDCDVVIFDLDSSKQEHTLALQQLNLIKPTHVPLIVVSSTIDDDLVRSFLQLRVADWLKIPATSREAEICVMRVLRRGEQVQSKAKCLTFVGAKGGVGTTTLAINAAVMLQRQLRQGEGACVVDLDFENACCADFLDLPASWLVSEMQENPSRMDERMLGSMMSAHRSGVQVLSGKSLLSQSDTLDEEVVLRPLEVAFQKYAALVVDVPRSGLRWLENVVPGTTDLFIVTDFTVPGLKAARAMLDNMKKRALSSVEPRVIINKYRRSLFGSNLTLAEARELLGSNLAGSIPDEPKLVQEAINRGVPTTEIKSRNPVMSGLKEIFGNQAVKPNNAKGAV